jgi:hypothetical protein
MERGSAARGTRGRRAFRDGKMKKIFAFHVRGQLKDAGFGGF